MEIQKKIIYKSPRFIYAVYSDGRVTKTLIKDEKNEQAVEKHKDCGGWYVWLGKNRQYIKYLVANNFLKKGKGRRRCAVEYIDGNEDNCSAENLRYAKRDASDDNPSGTKVMIDGVLFNSISDAERSLGVSHGYLTRYFKGQRNSEKFKGKEIKMVKKEN